MRELVIRWTGSGETRPVVASAALLAAGVIRSMAIKRYTPPIRKRELELLRLNPESHPTRCTLYRERGNGSIPTIVVGGFVPDATETVEFQRELLRQYGSIYYLNYSRTAFSRDMFAAQLLDLVDSLERKRQKPVIFSVSFGCGLVMDIINRIRPELRERIGGLALVSPVLRSDDLIRPEGRKQGGVRILEHNLKKILDADHSDKENIARLIERSRRCFQALFTGGAENRVLSMRHLAIKKRVFNVISGTSAMGGFERVMAFRDLGTATPDGVLFDGPMLTLLAEREEDMLTLASPTLRLFRDTDGARGLFPRCQICTVHSHDPNDGVPHASLIFHHQAYRGPIRDWYEKLASTPLRLAV